MQRETRKSLDRRLARIEGQVRGLRRMVAEGEYCCDVLTQLSATCAALDQVGAEMAASHVQTCVVGHGGEGAHPKANALPPDELMEELRTTLSRLVR